MSARALANLLTGATTSGAAVWLRGVITATTTGPNTVTVRINGSTATVSNVRYLASYTPTVGDTVEILSAGADRICLGKLA